jgi:hypothetical protein
MREIKVMQKRAVEAHVEAIKAVVGDLPTDLTRGVVDAAIEREWMKRQDRHRRTKR